MGVGLISNQVEQSPGRFQPVIVLDDILPQRVGATLVSVCEPGGFADDVRAATRERIWTGSVVDFVEEALTWWIHRFIMPS